MVSALRSLSSRHHPVARAAQPHRARMSARGAKAPYGASTTGQTNYTAHNTPKTSANTSHFSGCGYDGAQGEVLDLWYFRARYFDAELGRFISRDPLTYVDGMSMYRAVFAPMGIDPYGLIDLDRLIERGISLRDDVEPYIDVARSGRDLYSNITGNEVSAFRIGSSEERLFSSLEETSSCEIITQTHVEIKRVVRFLGENWRLSPLHNPDISGPTTLGDTLGNSMFDRMIGSGYRTWGPMQAWHGYEHNALITDWMSYQIKVDIFRSVRTEVTVRCNDYCSISSSGEVDYTKTSTSTRLVSCLGVGQSASVTGGVGFDYNRPHSGGGSFSAPASVGANISSGRFDFSIGATSDLLNFDPSGISGFCNVVFRP